MVDTGVDLGHPDLRGRLASLPDGEILGLNLVIPGKPPADDNGHGTHIAGIVAATAGDNARIMPIKALRSHGRGPVSDIALGIRWAVDHGARLISVSMGTPSYRRDLAEAVRHAGSTVRS